MTDVDELKRLLREALKFIDDVRDDEGAVVLADEIRETIDEDPR